MNSLNDDVQLKENHPELYLSNDLHSLSFSEMLHEIEAGLFYDITGSSDVLLANSEAWSIDVDYKERFGSMQSLEVWEDVVYSFDEIFPASFDHRGGFYTIFSQPMYVTKLQVIVKSPINEEHILYGLIGREGEKKYIGKYVKPEVIIRDDVTFLLYEINDYIAGVCSHKETKLVFARTAPPVPLTKLTRIGDVLDGMKSFFASLEKDKLNVKNVKKILRERNTELNDISDELVSLSSTKKHVVEQIKEEKLRLSSLKEDEKRLSFDLKQAYSELTLKNQELNELANHISRLKEQESEDADNLEKTARGLYEKEAELEKMDDEIRKAQVKRDTYSLDLVGHLKESRIQVVRYSALSLTFVAFLATIFYLIYGSANELVWAYKTFPSLNVGQLLLSRLPLITSTALIITALSGVLYLLINHIVSLNTDRMNMLKSAVLAEQISVAMANEHDLTSEQRKEESRRIKIELLHKLFAPTPEVSKSDSNVGVSQLTKLLEALAKIK